MLRRLTAILLAGSLAFAPAANACTGIQLTAEDGTVVAARTLEFGMDLAPKVTVVPAGTEVTGELPDGADGVTFKTKYGIVGMSALDQLVIVDGINEGGLYVGLFYFPGYASYPDLVPENRGRALAPQQYGLWLLANFSSIDEVKAHYADVVLAPTVVEELGGPAPVHYVVHDRTGKSVVIEPVGGSLKIHDNPLGVVTNAPTFDWHMTNLSNYVNLTVTNAPPATLSELKVSSFGQGSGMHGLPGDFTPPSRFVRAVAFSQSAMPVDTGRDAVLQAFHILNNFDIPKGAVRGEDDGKPAPDYTQWTAASDLQALVWTVKTYDDQTLRSVDLESALKAAGDKIMYIDPDWQQPITDISTQFK